MKTLLIVLSMSVCSIMLIALFSSFDPFTGGPVKCKIHKGPEPTCCKTPSAPTPSVTDSFDNRRFFIDTEKVNWTTARICPCDSTLVELDMNAPWSEEEENAVAKSTSKTEGNTLFSLPEMQIFDSTFVGPRSIPQPGDQQRPLRVAILDTGLADTLLTIHRAEIKGRRNMFDFTDTTITDTRGHGSVVFSIIDRAASGRASADQIDYYIYKCINDEGFASTFTLACALKCAMIDSVDIINLSLGAYVNDSIIEQIVQTELERPALIASEGNDCANTNKYPHYPSDYERAFGIMGVNADCTRPRPRADLWGCSNGAARKGNIAAPCVITSTTGGRSSGTSFAAAYVSGKYADYLISHYSLPGEGPLDYAKSNPYEIFRDQFRSAPAETKPIRKYLFAVDDCVNYSSLK